MAKDEDEHWAGSASVTEHIRATMAQFTRAERRVARRLLMGEPTAGMESAARLAEQTGVSGPTVIRFVNRLGFSRYGDFQSALRDELNARVVSPVELYRAHTSRTQEDEEKAAHRRVSALADGVVRSLTDLSPHELATACRLLAEPARRVVTLGGWFSHVHARYFAALLQEVRANVRFVGDAADERVALLMDARPRDIAVVFDFRRYEQRTRHVARQLHERGMKVVLFTDRWLSPVADFADVVLPATVDSESPFDTMVPAFALVELVVTGTVDLLGDAGRSRFEAFSDASTALTERWGIPPNVPHVRSGDDAPPPG